MLRIALKCVILLDSLIGFVGFLKIFPSPSRGELNRIRNKLDVSPALEKIELARMGPPGDGGYYIPLSIGPLRKCLSPGVGPSTEFEKALFDAFGTMSYLIDPTVPLVKAPYIAEHKRLFLGSYCSSHVVDLDTWIHELNLGSLRDSVLQMDIEGAELEVISSASQLLLSDFKVILIEFHKLNYLATKPFANVFEACLDKLLLSHSIVYSKTNINDIHTYIQRIKIPYTMEVTLLRNDLVKKLSQQ